MSNAPITTENIANPFDKSGGVAPFSGRDTELSTLHQHLTDVKDTHATLYLGRWRIGKTALLRNFSGFFDDTFIGIYIPLSQVDFTDDKAWLLTLFQAVDYYIKQRGITQSKQFPSLPDDEDTDLQQWFKETFLPDTFHTIRPQRRLAILLDDVQFLIEAVDKGQLSDDTFAYLHSLMDAQLGIALTLPVDNENDVDKLAPLIISTQIRRLSNLTLDATKSLFRETLPTMEIASIERVFASTGGNPYVLQRFGYHLHETRDEAITQSERVQQIHSLLNREQHNYFLSIWKNLTQNERFVLTALSGLLYENPIQQITPITIEKWLVETEYLMDTTAINAVLRSLEYREIVQLKDGVIQFVATLMRDWIIEHAQINVNQTHTENQTPKRIVWVLVALFIIVLFGLLLIISESNTANDNSQESAPPTVTIVPPNNG